MDVFVIAAVHQGAAGSDPAAQGPVEVVQALARRAGIQPRHLQEALWVTGSDLPLPAFETVLPPTAPLIFLPQGELSGHFALHAAARALQLGERRLVVVGQHDQEGAAALLLASPAAVGGYNLAPRARLALWLTARAAPEDGAQAVAALLRARARSAREAQQRLEEALALAVSGGGAAALPAEEVDLLPDPGEIGALAWDGPTDPQPLQAAFPTARLLETPAASPGDLFPFPALLEALSAERRWGLLLSPGRSALLATLVEKV